MRRIARILLSVMMLGLLLAQPFDAGVPAVSAATQRTYRALLIGNDAYQQSPLKGSVNDAKAIRSALQSSTAIRYGKIELMTNLTEGGIAQAITGLQDWDVKSDDVTLIFYSGHGYRDGNTGATGIVGVDMRPYGFDKMERSLGLLQGTVVLLVDSCYSGGVIGKSVQPKSAPSASKGEISAYNQAVIDVFNTNRTLKSKALTGSKYHVITSASGSELSYESGGYGFFTTGLAEAMGWNVTKGAKTSQLAGDANGDGVVSVSEAYEHARQVVSDLRGKTDQNVQISPAGSTLALVGREGSSSPGQQPPTQTQDSEPSSTPGASGLPNLSTAILASGQVLRLNGTGLSWKSSKPTVASVSAAGLVTAHKSGKALVTGSRGGKIVVKCTVGVMSGSKVVSAIRLSASSIKKGVGSSHKLKAKISPSSAYRKAVKWYSSDKSVATVSSAGVVKAKRVGTAKIYAIASSGMVDSCSVEVVPASVSKVQQKKSKASVLEGKTLKLQAKALPQSAANRKLTWSSADKSIATVDPSTGVVTGVAPGKVYITAASTDGSNKSARCLVTVGKNKFSRKQVTSPKGKLRSGATSIRYSEDGKQLLIEIGFVNQTAKELMIPKKGAKLYFRAGKAKAYKAIASVEAEITRLSSGGEHVVSYRVPLTDKNVKLAGLDLRKTDAYVK